MRDGVVVAVGEVREGEEEGREEEDEVVDEVESLRSR